MFGVDSFVAGDSLVLHTDGTEETGHADSAMDERVEVGN